MKTSNMNQSKRTQLLLTIMGLLTFNFVFLMPSYAEGSCIKSSGRGGYTISRNCVYQGRDEPEARVTNIYLGGAVPVAQAAPMDAGYSPAYGSYSGYGQSDAGANVCAAAQYQMPQYPQMQQQPSLRQVAPGVYVQSQARLAQYARPQYMAPQYLPQPLVYGQVAAASMNPSPQLFQQAGQMNFQVQNAPLLLSPSALSQAVPVYLIQNANYGQFQASAPAPAVQRPVAAPVQAPAPRTPQYQGVISNNVQQDAPAEQSVDGGDSVEADGEAQAGAGEQASF